MSVRDSNQRIARYATQESRFNFPFSYILADKFKVKDIVKPLPYTNEAPYDPGLFPRNITNYIWSSIKFPQEGAPDDLSWLLLCKLNNGNYAFYSAECRSDFDDPNAKMSITVSPRLSDIIMQILTDDQYSLYERKTMPLPTPLPYEQDSDYET